MSRDRYALEARPIGSGGQAEVFSARDKETGEQVAFKRVLSHRREDIARMQREIEALKALRHDHIMPLLDADDKGQWYTMPLALGSLHQQREAISPDEFKLLVLNIATALQFAHEKGFVHRDVKPQNILKLDERFNNKWVVADWGVALPGGIQGGSSLTSKGVQLGTPGYMAPEGWGGSRKLTASSDVYSLGRVVSWFFRGVDPIPNTELDPQNDFWRPIVRSMCAERNDNRLPSMSYVINGMELMEHSSESEFEEMVEDTHSSEIQKVFFCRFKLSCGEEVFVHPIEREDYNRLRGILFDDGDHLRDGMFSFGCLDGREIVLRLQSVEFISLPWEMDIGDTPTDDPDGDDLEIRVYFRDSPNAYEFSTDHPETVADMIFYSETGVLDRGGWFYSIDEDGEELFFRAGQVAMIDVPSQLAAEGHAIRLRE